MAVAPLILIYIAAHRQARSPHDDYSKLLTVVPELKAQFVEIEECARLLAHVYGGRPDATAQLGIVERAFKSLVFEGLALTDF